MNRQWEINEQIQYRFHPYQQWLMQSDASAQILKNSKVQQDTRLYAGNVTVSNQFHAFTQSIRLHYDYYYDKGIPEDTLSSTRNAYRYAQYGLDWVPKDSLLISAKTDYHYDTKSDRYNTGSHFISNGTGQYYLLQYGWSKNNLYIGTISSWDQADQDYAYRRKGMTMLRSHWGNEYNDFLTTWQFQENNENTYTFLATANEDENKSYVEINKQYRRFLLGSMEYRKRWDSGWSMSLVDEVKDEHNRYPQSSIKSNQERKQDALLNLFIPVTKRLNLTSEIQSVLTEKTYATSASNTDSEIRHWKLTAYMQIGTRDSLIVSRLLELNRTNYPETTTGFDNDNLKDITQLTLQSYLNDRIRFRTGASYSSWQNVNIKSNSSGNNNTRTSLLLQPGFDVAIGDRWIASQAYKMQADYIKYNFQLPGQNDTYFRELSALYKLDYSSSPLIRKIGSAYWLHLPSGPADPNPLNFYISYNYKENNSGQKVDGVYHMTSTLYTNLLTMQLQKYLGRWQMTLRPRLTWGSQTDYDYLATTQYDWNERSSCRFSINPSGISIHNAIWRYSLDLTYQF